MASSDGGEIVLWLVVGVGILFFIFYVVLPFLAIVLAVGATTGAGVSIYNYGLAIKNNIRPEGL